MMFIKGIGALLLTLCVFSLFSLKFPKGSVAMGGLANSAIATFLVEAICKYILGDLFGMEFFVAIGESAGSLGGPAAAIMVGLAMGTDPVCVAASAMALKGFGILPGFIAGYILHFVISPILKRIPDGIDIILCSLLSATLSYGICRLLDPAVTLIIGAVGDAILVAAEQSPIAMGFLLGGIIKVVCTSPLSSMALTAMLGLTGLPMGIACIACFGGAFSNGMVFWKLHLGDRSKVIAVILEPLTQADIVTRNAVPIYTSSFLSGGLSGICAAALGIVCNAPGTASPIPGMLAPFAFNSPLAVAEALAAAFLCGVTGGAAVGTLFKKRNKNEMAMQES